MTPTHEADIAIIGGGIAGLWLLNLLRGRGYNAVLIEKQALGCGQSLSSQGMIHGGVKYTLAAAVTPASETIAAMPGRWRDCLAGEGSLNLQGVRVLSDHYYMFTDHGTASKLTAFLGSKALRGRVEPVRRAAAPAAFSDPGFAGLLYRLQDLVLDVNSLLTHLAARFPTAIYQGDARFGTRHNLPTRLHLQQGVTLAANTFILAAGKGNGDLIEQLELPLGMQLRPLHQVIVKGSHLPDMFAHAVAASAGDKPRLTITTHPTDDGSKVWYLGGKLAESGINRSPREQIRMARQELAALLPWIPLDSCEFSTWRMDRAEAARPAASPSKAQRPDTPCVKKFQVKRLGNVIVCWPTKLTLVPLLGDLVLKQLDKPAPGESPVFPGKGYPEAITTGTPPWIN